MPNAAEILKAASQSMDGWIDPEQLAEKIERGAPFCEVSNQLCSMLGAEEPEEIRAGLCRRHLAPEQTYPIPL